MLKKLLSIARTPSALVAVAIFFLAGMVVWPQAQPPSMYDPKLISYNATPFGTCQVDQVALNTSNGAFYSCAPLTHVWVGSQAAALPMSITQGGFTHTLTGATTAARTWTLQDASDTFVFRSTTDTLTNKTLTSPSIASPSTTGTDSGTETLQNKTLDCTANTLSKNACVVYSTASASTNASISATTMATAGGSGNTYRVSWYFTNTALGTSCTGNSTVQFNLIWNDPSEGSAVSSPVQNLITIGSGTANGVLGPIPTHANYNGFWNTLPFRAKANTAVQYSVTFVAGANCSPAPSYQVFPVLEQIQ